MRYALSLLLALSITLAGCDRDEPAAGQAGEGATAEKRNVVIAFIGKSLANDVFRVAEVGARDAARELADKYNAQITLEVRTPSEEDATRQAEAIDAMARLGADAIIVSASEANTLRNAIDRAVDRGTLVMTFDSDVPDSKRFAYYGCDDITSGARLMDLLATSMGDKGTIAILAGNESAPNLQKRVKGVRDQLAKHPGMKLLEPNGVFYHQETPEKAAEAVANAMNANPGIEGWAMIGGWPLFTTNALRWEPGAVKVISWDALPAQLSYLKSGHVDVLLAQDCYGWGHKSVETVLEKLINKKDPPQVHVVDPLTPVTRENVDEWAKNWEKWLPR